MKKRLAYLLSVAAGAATMMLTVTGCGPSTAEGCLKAGAECGANGNWKQTLKLANRAESLDPDNVSALVLRAVAYDALGERDPALDAARQAAARNPEDFAAQYTLGRLYAQEPARYADALQALTRAASLSKFKDRNTLVLLTDTLVAQRSPSAVSWLEVLRRSDPSVESNAAYCNLLGIAQARAKHPDEAKDAFTKAYRLDRGNAMIVYNIATFFDRYAANPRAAAQFYQAFLGLAGEKAEFTALKSDVNGRLARMRR